MAAVCAAGPEPMIATLVWGGLGCMLGCVEAKVRGWFALVAEGREEEEEEEGEEKGEAVIAAVCFCCEAVEAARVKGRPERREVWILRRKVEENSLMVVIGTLYGDVVWKWKPRYLIVSRLYGVVFSNLEMGLYGESNGMWVQVSISKQ
jgi:hypothetical protein